MCKENLYPLKTNLRKKEKSKQRIIVSDLWVAEINSNFVKSKEHEQRTEILEPISQGIDGAMHERDRGVGENPVPSKEAARQAFEMHRKIRGGLSKREVADIAEALLERERRMGSFGQSRPN